MSKYVDLFNGIALIIDDELNNTKANITKLLNELSKRNIPQLQFTSLPDTSYLLHFQELSFVLLDWHLIKPLNSEERISIGDGLKQFQEGENIKFIKDLRQHCFCPIFIFSNENLEEIKEKLIDEKVFSESKTNQIFIKAKRDIIDNGGIFKTIEDWLITNPSSYVLKQWDHGYKKAKNALFKSFHEKSPNWPLIIWDSLRIDGGNKSLVLGELISRNLYSRMAPFQFKDDVLEKETKEIVDKNELRTVLEGERFLDQEFLEEEIGCGDLFKIKSKYYINIRANCDLIPGRREQEKKYDDIKLYLLRGRKLSEDNIKLKFLSDYQKFVERECQSILFPLSGGLAIDFHFKDLEIKTWKECKQHRVGRILSPYIDSIQQRYALYLTRQGFPPIPYKAIITEDDN